MNTVVKALVKALVNMVVKGGRRPALLAGLLAVCALSACGVPPSDVIQAGEPATGMPPGTLLYFLSGDGALVAVPRGGAPDVALAVDQVFKGPTATEVADVRTQLPRLPSPPAVKDVSGTVLVELPAGVAPLTPLAVRQLTCTVAAAYRAEPSTAKRLAAKRSGIGRSVPAGPVPTVPPEVSGSSPGAPYPGGGAGVLVVRISGAGWARTQMALDCPPG
ncbi:hypothetical protein ACFO3J_16685 [Streptomyces polygonati]|uniref:Lipoprotein n=1 Tax=Streptomyces polygonati TaxID=1617087 RepID=A0ABV8HNC5_9ACTN